MVLGTGAHELDHLAVAVGGLAELAAGLVDHAEPIVAIVHFGVPDQQFSGGLLGLIEAACMDQVDYGVRGCIQGLGVLPCGQGFVSLSSLVGLLILQGDALGGGGRKLGRPVFFQATVLVLLTTAARAQIVATGFWHVDPSYQDWERGRLAHRRAAPTPPAASPPASTNRRDYPSVPRLAARPEVPHPACAHRPRVRGAMSCRRLPVRWQSPPS